jgi:excisionase family DNA binding protein
LSFEETAHLKHLNAYSTAISPCTVHIVEELTMSTSSEKVPIHLKTTLTIKEAAEYSNIGINKIESLLKQPNCPFVLYVGTKKLVKRKAFEAYIDGKVAI